MGVTIAAPVTLPSSRLPSLNSTVSPWLYLNIPFSSVVPVAPDEAAYATPLTAASSSFPVVGPFSVLPRPLPLLLLPPAGEGPLPSPHAARLVASAIGSKCFHEIAFL